MKTSMKTKIRREKIKVKRLQKVIKQNRRTVQFLSNTFYGLYRAIVDNNREAIELGHKLLVEFYEKLELDNRSEKSPQSPISQAEPSGNVGDGAVRGESPSDQISIESA